MTSDTIRFKADTAMRKRFFHESAMSHPAKLHGGLFLEIMERYTKPGDVILDPMAGIGTALLATMYSRSVILNEMESHFLETLPKSWAIIQRNGPALGHTMGSVLIMRGDARCLPLNSADCVVTSPPYAEGLGHDAGERVIDKVKGLYNARGVKSYTRPVDAIVSSPPYAEGLGHDVGHEREIDKAKGLYNARGTESYAPDSTTNIGNQKGDAYWESMRQVYAECHRVLRPGGIMALVLKGFTRDGKYVDLPAQTQALCESLGFVKFDEWRRELWALSFWRILQKRRDPQAFDERLKYETVLAFRKLGASGLKTPSGEDVVHAGYDFQGNTAWTNGLDAVVTSPPYEGSLQGEPGIDWTKMDGGKRDMSKEPYFETRLANHSGYTRKPSKLFTEPRGRWKGDNANRKSRREPLSKADTREEP